MMRKGPSHALVTTALTSGGLAVGFAASSGLSALASGGLTSLSTLISTGLAGGAGLITALSGPFVASATPFFTTFLDLFSGFFRGSFDVSSGGALFTEALSSIGLGGGTPAAAAAPVAAPCPFC